MYKYSCLTTSGLTSQEPGNYYQEFLEGLVQLDTDCTKKFLIQVGSKALAEGRGRCRAYLQLFKNGRCDL